MSRSWASAFAVAAVLLAVPALAHVAVVGRKPVAAGPAALAAGCTVVGRLLLAGRDAHDGIAVAIEGRPAVPTGPDGRFSLDDVAAGTLRLRATRSRYLEAAAEDVPCVAGAVTTMAELELAGGDGDGNGRIDLFDLVRVTGRYRTCAADAGYDAVADLNDSGCIDLFDLVMVTGSYDRAGPLAWAVVGSSEPYPVAASFRTDVLPTFQRSCRGCHGFAAGLTLDSYATLMAGGTNGPVIVPGDPQASRLYLRVSRQLEPYMPPGTMRLSDAELDALRRWIASGAPDN